MKKRFWLALGIIMLARLPFLHISFFSVDEAVSVVAAHEILEGGLPYRDAIDHRGPLTYYFYAFVFLLSGKGQMWAIHLVYTLLHLCIALLGYKLAKKWSQDDEVAAWTILIYALISSCNYFTEGLAAHTEWLLALFSLLAWWLFFQATSFSSAKWILIGCCLGLAISSKQVAGLEAVAIGAGLWLAEGKLSEKVKKSLWLSAGVMLPILAFVLLFVRAQALQDLIFYVFTYNTQFYLPELSLHIRLLNTFKLLGSFLINNWILLPIAMLSLWFFISPKEGSFPKKISNNYLILLWLIGSMGEALAGGRAFGHYLIPAMMPISMWGGMMLNSFAKQLSSKTPLMAGGFQALLVMCIAGPLIMTYVQHRHMLGHDPSISEYQQVSLHLKDQLDEGDHIFVWGFAPEIYVLSHTRPASRFTFCNPLTGHLPASNESIQDTRYAIVPASWDSLQRDFSRHAPLYIVDTQPAGFKAYGKFPMKNYPFWEVYLKNYELDSLFLNNYPSDSIRLFKRSAAADSSHN